MKKLSLFLILSASPAMAASGPFFSLRNTDFVVTIAFLLFAYATMSDRAGGSLREGLQVAGNARIVGIANASVVLLLEAIHGGGKTEGHGSLDVSIDICWCYTLHVRKDVSHQIN